MGTKTAASVEYYSIHNGQPPQKIQNQKRSCETEKHMDTGSGLGQREGDPFKTVLSKVWLMNKMWFPKLSFQNSEIHKESKNAAERVPSEGAGLDGTHIGTTIAI